MGEYEIGKEFAIHDLRIAQLEEKLNQLITELQTKPKAGGK